MPIAPPSFKPRGVSTPSAYDRERRSLVPTRRLYATARWRAIRAMQLATEPLCRMCLDAGVAITATVCDHITPHRGDVAAFWSGPFQSLCASCHSAAKQRAEGMGGSDR